MASPDGQVTVLVVDDDADVRDSTAAMLQGRGFGVVLAADAAQAILVCRVHEPPVDVLVTDLEMPGVSGCELARAVTHVNPMMPIVYISGIPADTAVSRGLLAPTDRLISKPFGAALLVETLRTVLTASGRLAAEPDTGRRGGKHRNGVGSRRPTRFGRRPR